MTRKKPITTKVIRHGSFGPIVWDTATGQTRAATQEDMDSLEVGPDLTPEEEAEIEEED
jgi:hypothetical protein